MNCSRLHRVQVPKIAVRHSQCRADHASFGLPARFPFANDGIQQGFLDAGQDREVLDEDYKFPVLFQELATDVVKQLGERGVGRRGQRFYGIVDELIQQSDRVVQGFFILAPESLQVFCGDLPGLFDVIRQFRRNMKIVPFKLTSRRVIDAGIFRYMPYEFGNNAGTSGGSLNEQFLRCGIVEKRRQRAGFAVPDPKFILLAEVIAVGAGSDFAGVCRFVFAFDRRQQTSADGLLRADFIHFLAGGLQLAANAFVFRAFQFIQNPAQNGLQAGAFGYPNHQSPVVVLALLQLHFEPAHEVRLSDSRLSQDRKNNPSARVVAEEFFEQLLLRLFFRLSRGKALLDESHFLMDRQKDGIRRVFRFGLDARQAVCRCGPEI